MKIAIVGSRDFNDLETVRQFVRNRHPTTIIISGGARGVDATAVDEAKRLHMGVEVYPADWDRFGKSAGFRRNQTIVDAADEIVAFWDGISKGTQHTISLAEQAGKPVRVIREER